MFTWIVSTFKLSFLFLVLLGVQITHAQGFKLFKSAFKSKYLKASRSLYVYTPASFPSLTKNKSSFPVIFFHDGQNLYDPQRSVFGTTWQLEKTLNTLIHQKIIPPVVVVGIDNTVDRIYEYTFSKDKYGRGAGAQLYLQFITRELIPLIEQNFPVTNDRSLIGSSLGGLVSLYGATNFTSYFTRIAALSPSLWWNEYDIFNVFKRTSTLPSVVYVDSGTIDGERPQDILELDKIMNR